MNGKRNLKTSTYFSQLMAKCELVQYIFTVSFRQRRFHMRERGMTFLGLGSLHYYARLKKKLMGRFTNLLFYLVPTTFGADKYWCFLFISEITASKYISNFIIWVSKWGTKIQTLFWFFIPYCLHFRMMPNNKLL